MKIKSILFAIIIALNAINMTSVANESRKLSTPALNCKIIKHMNGIKELKIEPKKGSLHFEIPYYNSDCDVQTYKLKAKKDSLIIIEHNKVETCMRHLIGYFLVGDIQNLKKGTYYISVVNKSWTGTYNNLINKTIKVTVP